GVGDVVGQAKNLGDLHTGTELDLESRDRRTARHRGDGGIDAEVLQGSLENARDLFRTASAAAAIRRPAEDRDGRKRVRRALGKVEIEPCLFGRRVWTERGR